MNRAILGFACIGGLAACDAKSNLKNFEYPPSSAYDSKDWPTLEPTNTLIQNKATLTPNQATSLSNLSARATALRGKTQRLRTAPVSSARIASLKRRAAALRAFEF